MSCKTCNGAKRITRPLVKMACVWFCFTGGFTRAADTVVLKEVGNSAEEIGSELSRLSNELPAAGPGELSSLRRMSELAEELEREHADALFHDTSRMKLSLLKRRLDLGDAAAEKTLRSEAGGSGPEAFAAHLLLLESAWSRAGQNTASQAQLVAEARDLTRRYPDYLYVMAATFRKKAAPKGLNEALADPLEGATEQARRKAELEAEVAKLAAEWQPMRRAIRDMTDPRERQAVAPKAVPLLTRMTEVSGQLQGLDPWNERRVLERLFWLAYRLALGDAGAEAILARLAQGDNPAAVAAGCERLRARWWLAGTDPELRARVLDEACDLARRHPEHNSMVSVFETVASSPGLLPEKRGRLAATVGDVLKGASARRLARWMQEEWLSPGVWRKRPRPPWCVWPEH